MIYVIYIYIYIYISIYVSMTWETVAEHLPVPNLTESNQEGLQHPLPRISRTQLLIIFTIGTTVAKHLPVLNFN